MVGWFKLGCTLQKCSDKLEVLTYIVFLSFLTCLMQYSKHLSYLLGGLPSAKFNCYFKACTLYKPSSLIIIDDIYGEGGWRDGMKRSDKFFVFCKAIYIMYVGIFQEPAL